MMLGGMRTARARTIKATPKRSMPAAEEDGLIVAAMKMKMKLLQFHEDVRPPYYGTFTKHCLQLSGRRPFSSASDVFDYEYDSEAEWDPEDAEAGDACDSGADDDREEGADGEDDQVDEDNWLVPHGYLSEDEGLADGEGKPLTEEERAERLERLRAAGDGAHPKSARPAKPFSYGCLWDADATAHLQLGRFSLQALVPTPINPLEMVEATKVTECASPTKKDDGAAVSESKVSRFPDALMPELLRLVHGSAAGLEKLVADFCANHTSVTKAAVTRVLKDPTFSVREIRSPYRRNRRFVPEATLKKWGLVLPLPQPDGRDAITGSKRPAAEKNRIASADSSSISGTRSILTALQQPKKTNPKMIGEWAVYHDASTQLPYYFNTRTSETRWELPEPTV